MDLSCNIAALLLFCFAAFGPDLGITETRSSREERLAAEAKERSESKASAQRERDIARQKIEDEARRKAQKAASAQKAIEDRRAEMEAIEAAITEAEALDVEGRHAQARVLSERVRQFLRTFGETDENMEWTAKIKGTRLRPLGH